MRAILNPPVPAPPSSAVRLALGRARRSLARPLAAFVHVPPSPAAHRINAPPPLRAFTLVEVMVAMAIFGMVMVAIYSSWSAILRGAKVGLNAAAEAQRTRVAARAIRDALTSGQLYVENVRYYWFMADTSGDFAALSLVSRLPSSFPGSGLFGDQIVRRVSFTVEPGPGGLRQLVLRQTPLLEPPETAPTPYTTILAPNVNQFSLEFWNTNTLEWDPEWPFTNQLPKLVRFAVSIGPPNHKPAIGDTAIQTALVSSVAIPRMLQVPPIRRGFGGVPGGPR